MAVPISNVTRRQVYAPSGAGGAGPYAFTFEILSNTDIAVFKDDTLLTLTTHYTVTINANGTGSVTITGTGLALAPASPTQYAIVGNRTISRTTDFTTGGDFFANTLNDELDQQTIFSQQNAEGLQRALVAPQTDPTSINMTLPRASLRANKVLVFDATGNPVIGETVGTNRGNWASGTLYYVRDIVKDTSNSNIYQVITQHTSSGSQPISSNVDVAKWALLVDAAAAAASASAAASSASAASTSASNASASASAASTSATNASTSASSASTSATNAASSASAASTSATNAAASYDSFDDRYLGPKATPPTLDNDGNALLTGALYFDTTLNLLQVYSGTAWVSIVSGPASSTDNAIARFDGTTGKLIKNSSALTYNSTTGKLILFDGASGGGAVGIGTPTISTGYSLDVQNSLVLARIESTTGANAALSVVKNTAGSSIFGNAGSTPGSTFTGSYAYATLLGTDSARALQFATNNIVRAEIGSTGNFAAYGSISTNTSLSVNTFATIGTTLGVTGATTLSSTLSLGGTVSGGGNQINNVVIGASNPLAGAFTTVVATKAAAGDVITFTNGGATPKAGYLYSASNFSGLFADASAAGTGVAMTSGSGTTIFSPDQTKSLAVSNTGTAVTGALSSTLAATFGQTGASGTTSQLLSLIGRNSDGYAQFNFLANNGSTNNAFIGATSAGLEISTGSVVRGTFSSTALALGVGISLTGGTSGTGYSFSGSAPATSLTLDSSGNLGIGNTNNSALLHVGKVSENGDIAVMIGNGATSSFTASTATLQFRQGGNGGATLNAGKIVSGRTGNYSSSADADSFLAFYTALDNTDTERARIDSSGNLLVGTTSTVAGAVLVASKSVADYVVRFINTNATAYGLVVSYSGASPNSTGQEFFRCVDSTADRMLVRSNGGIANYSANNVNLSDRREKTNFAAATSYLDKICAIPVQTFNYIDQNLETDDGLTLGVVAQDVQSIAPELVMESNWGSKEEPKMRLSIYQTDLQYALMKCIQEQQALITQLTARVAQLESKA